MVHRPHFAVSVHVFVNSTEPALFWHGDRFGNRDSRCRARATRHALSDETRARTLLALREAPAAPSDLADELGVSRQVMSNQRSCLRGLGLVEGVKDGRITWYRLAEPELAPALDDLLCLVLTVDRSCCAGPECTCA